MKLTASVLATIAGKPVNDNMRSIVAGLDAYGAAAGLDKPHRLAHYIDQLAHESGAFRYDREVWGPTAAQKRYDTRTDLGNTPEADGDGKLYSGKGPMQITGKANVTAFRDWCRAKGLNPPDFVKNPELINTDPWEGLGPIWYWSTRNLNKFADANDLEMITRKINGGTNGLADRINWYTRAALVLAGFGPTDVAAFQRQAQASGLLPAGADQIDGIAGPKTRAALHLTLAAEAPATATRAAPVVQETVVAPKGADRTLMQRIAGGAAVVAPASSFFLDFDQTGKFIMLGIGIAAVGILIWRGERIAARVREVLAAFDGEAVK
jgi:putative chitinase